MNEQESPTNGMKRIRYEINHPPVHETRKRTIREFVIMFQRPIVYGMAVLLWLALGGALYFTYFNPLAGPSVFVLSNLQMNGPAELCPGDTLDFQFDVQVKEVGVYNLFMSTWKVDPPPSTIIFSELQPFVVGSHRSFPIVREWKIPVTYLDPANNQDTPMVSGAYIRDIAVTAEGRNTTNKPLQVVFNIKKGCGT